MANTLEIWLQSYKKIFAEFGFSPSTKEIVGIFGNWEGPKLLGILNNDEFITKLMVEVNNLLPTVKLHDQVFETISEIKNNGGKVAIVTSSKRDSVFPRLESNDLLQFADVFLSKEDVIKHKPDPEMINKAIDMIGGNKNETLIVGDSDKDIISGKNAGITTVVYFPEINHQFYTLSELRGLKADFLITDFSELLKIALDNKLVHTTTF